MFLEKSSVFKQFSHGKIPVRQAGRDQPDIYFDKVEFTLSFDQKLRAAKKQLSGSGYSVIASVIIGKRIAFLPPPAAPAGRRRCTAPRRRRQSADYRWRGG